MKENYIDKTISIGIATFNRVEFLKKTVLNVLDQKVISLLEIVILDQTPDKSITDDLKVYFENLDKRIIYLTQDVPAVSLARNKIILKAKSDIILFLDDDVILGDKCIQSHLSVYNYQNIKSCIGHIHHRKPSFDVSKLDINKPRNGTENLMPESAGLDLDFKGVSISCNQSFDRLTLLELGGFDENFVGGYYEDADLGMRLKKASYKIAFHPDAMVVHIKAPQGGLRFEAKQPFTEKDRLLSYVLFLFRYPTEYGLLNGIWATLRAGPFRKVNALNPFNHVKSWINLGLSFIEVCKVKGTVKSTILTDNAK